MRSVLHLTRCVVYVFCRNTESAAATTGRLQVGAARVLETLVKGILTGAWVVVAGGVGGQYGPPFLFLNETRCGASCVTRESYRHIWGERTGLDLLMQCEGVRGRGVRYKHWLTRGFAACGFFCFLLSSLMAWLQLGRCTAIESGV